MEIAGQVAAARARALAVPAVGHAVMSVTGADRRSWLNGLVTCDVAKIAPGEAIYGLVVGQKGRIFADLVVIDSDDRLLLVVPAPLMEELRVMFEHHLIMEDAEVVAPAAFGVFFVHGPASAAALDAARAAGAAGALFDVTGLGGAVVLSPGQVDAAVRSALMAKATLGDETGWEALRLERGVPRFGVDFDGATYPQEASIEKRAVSFEKGCYLGQEVVYMLEKRGHVKRKLVPLVLEGLAVPGRGDAVTNDAGEAVGEVSSAIESPTLGAPVALAMVKYAAAVPGTALVVRGARAVVREPPA